MKELTFDSGVVSYSLNGKCEVSFNPTDGTFAERFFNAFDELDRKQEAYKAEIETAKGNREIFDVARRLDAEMRVMIDKTFDQPVCEALFGTMNVYAMADGLPVWANLMLCVMDEMDTSFAYEQKRTNSRISKYTAKYHK